MYRSTSINHVPTTGNLATVKQTDILLQEYIYIYMTITVNYLIFKGLIIYIFIIRAQVIWSINKFRFSFLIIFLFRAKEVFISEYKKCRNGTTQDDVRKWKKKKTRHQVNKILIVRERPIENYQVWMEPGKLKSISQLIK